MLVHGCKTFLPLGSDEEAHSDFQLIAGTSRDLFAAVGQGIFREDLLARINLWTFSLPGLRSRAEKVEPNFDFELDRFAEKAGRRVTFNKEAREKFLSFALSPAALWANKKRAGCLLLGTGPMLLSEAMNSDRSFLANH